MRSMFQILMIKSFTFGNLPHCAQKSKLWKNYISTFRNVTWKSMRLFWKCHKVRAWSWYPDLDSLAQNKKVHNLRHYGLLGVLNTMLAFSYPGETDYDKKPCFLDICFLQKFLICAYWADNATDLTIWVSLLFTVFTISLNFQNMHIFFLKRFLSELFIILCATFLTSKD